MAIAEIIALFVAVVVFSGVMLYENYHWRKRIDAEKRKFAAEETYYAVATEWLTTSLRSKFSK